MKKNCGESEKVKKKAREKDDKKGLNTRKTWHARSERIWTVSVNYQEIALTWLSLVAKAENSLRIRTALCCGKTLVEKKGKLREKLRS